VTDEPRVGPTPAGARRRGGEGLGAALVAVSAVLFGTVVLFAKYALRTGMPVYWLLAARFAAAALLLFAVLGLLGRPLRPEAGERMGIVFLGMVGYAVEAAFFFASLRHGTAAAMTLLFFTYPVFVTLASWAIGRGRPNGLTAASLLAAVSGGGLIVGTAGDVAARTAGIVLALMSAVTYTGYMLGAAQVVRRTNALTAAAWQAGAASIGLAILAVASGNLESPSGWNQWWPILGMALATSGAFAFLLEGLQRIGAVRTAIVSALEPFFAAVFGTVFLAEPLGWGVAVGGLLIVAGAIAAALARATPVIEPPLP